MFTVIYLVFILSKAEYNTETIDKRSQDRSRLLQQRKR